MKSLTIALATLALAYAQPSLAACNLSIVPGADPTVTHDAFDSLPTQMSFSVQVTNNGDETCTSELVLIPSGGSLELRSGANVLPYTFRFPAGLQAGVEMGPIFVIVPAGTSKSIVFDAEIPRSVAAPGIYRGMIALRLRQDRQQVAEYNVNLTADVTARAQMSISGTRSTRGSMGPALINLGVLQDGDQGTVFVNVWANSSVRVRLSSENVGALKLADLPDLPGIPYFVSFDGDRRSLSAPIELRRTPAMNAGGESYPLTVSVPVVGPRYAGVYRDIITVSIDNN